MQDKAYMMIGMACRAGKVVTGEDLIRKAMHKDRAKLVIISEDASENTKEGYTDLCKFHNVKLVEFGTKDMLGKYVGKAERTAISINDEGFKKAILEKINIIENK